MSKLFSCFWSNKKTGDYSQQESVRRSRRPSRDNNEIVYVDTGAGNQHIFNGNVRHVYRTETNSQTPEYENTFGPDKNRQSRSYPVSPERRSLYKVYSFEQRPSFEKQRLVKRDSNNVMLYAASVSANPPQFNRTTENSDKFSSNIPVVDLPIRSVLNYGVDYEKEILSNERQLCKAERPAEECHKLNISEDKSVLLALGKDNNKYNQDNERFSSLRMSKRNSGEVLPRLSNMENQNLLYLPTNNVTTEPQIKTVIKTRPQSSKNFRLGGSVKMMTYRAEDVNRSPMSANKYVHQMPIRPTKPPVLTTADGRILMPLSSNTLRKLSSSSNNEKKPVRGFPLVTGGEAIVAAPMILGGGKTIDRFPLSQGQDVVVAAPMIGGGGKVKRGGKPQKSILRKEKKGKPQYRNEPEDDFYDDYPEERDYGRGNYREPYYDEGPDIYSPASYFSPMDGGYGYGRGYYDDGYGYPDDGMGSYRGGRSARHQVYTTQIPDITLPVTLDDKGKNPPFKKSGKPLDAPGTSGNVDYTDLTNEKPVNTKMQLTKGSTVQLISSGQQTDHELDFICFSPDGVLKTTVPPDDPNSKLRWKIIIKRGDED